MSKAPSLVSKSVQCHEGHKYKNKVAAKNKSYPDDGILYSNKKEQTSDTCNNMEQFQKHDAKQKKADSKSCMLYGSIYMIIWKR